MDGRALQALGEELQAEGACKYPLGLYFVCDPVVGARRTLGFANTPYDQLAAADRQAVDQFVAQISARNHADMTRSSQAVRPPEHAVTAHLPELPVVVGHDAPQMVIIDTAADLTKDDMARPVLALVQTYL